MAKCIMVQGTMSNVGKSLMTAGLCRMFKQDGYRVAPFKSQNMALNSFITEDGLEMGRAQVMQAEACGIKPDVLMNPILLKPTSDVGSQVIVNGEILGNYDAREYFAYKKNLVPKVKEAFEKLSEKYDIIVIEGAGSPAEINLKDEDLVNMGLAKMVNAPVLLVGDIDRGGVFAQLIGTLELLEPAERELVKGLVINKFRGDKSILDPGIDQLEKLGGIPVVGTVPYYVHNLEDEDSLTDRFNSASRGLIDIAVIRYPRISNFTDLNVFEQVEGLSVRYVTSPAELEGTDMVVLPGSKNTMGDVKWLRSSGMEAAIKKLAGSVPVFGICAGLQMLGEEVSDPTGAEEGGCVAGIGLLPIKTVIKSEKTRKQVTGNLNEVTGDFSGISGEEYEGYEVHMGSTCFRDGGQEFTEPVVSVNNVYGSYIHGIFDKGGIAMGIAKTLADKKGIELSNVEGEDYTSIKERQYDELADILRANMDVEGIYKIMGLSGSRR